MDDKWEWGEIVYVVKDFYSNIWTKDRPAVVDDDRLEGSVSESLIKVRKAPWLVTTFARVSMQACFVLIDHGASPGDLACRRAKRWEAAEVLVPVALTVPTATTMPTANYHPTGTFAQHVLARVSSW